MLKPEDNAQSGAPSARTVRDGVESADARRLPAAERHMTVSPIDMRQPNFGTSMRGFDRHEVTAFLDEAATDYEHALRENDRLRQEIVRLEASLNQFRELEGSLKTTLMSAQKVGDDMRENATKESARILREAEGRAELMVQKAQAKVEDIERDIDGLRLKRRESSGVSGTGGSVINPTTLAARHAPAAWKSRGTSPGDAPCLVASPARSTWISSSGDCPVSTAARSSLSSSSTLSTD